VVLAGQEAIVALGLGDDWESSMSTNVVECIYSTRVISGNDVLEASDVVVYPVSILGKSRFVRGEKPLLGEDASPLKVIHLLGRVPRGW